MNLIYRYIINIIHDGNTVEGNDVNFYHMQGKKDVCLTARNSLRRSSMLPLWMVKRAAAIWLIALARQWMLLQWPVGGSRRTRELISCFHFSPEKIGGTRRTACVKSSLLFLHFVPSHFTRACDYAREAYEYIKVHVIRRLESCRCGCTAAPGKTNRRPRRRLHTNNGGAHYNSLSFSKCPLLTMAPFISRLLCGSVLIIRDLE